MAEPESTHPHLQITREEPITKRRSRPAPVSPEPPDDPRSHGATLRSRLRAARDAVVDDLGGYDERRLIKIELTEKVSPEEISRASGGLEIVSQERKARWYWHLRPRTNLRGSRRSSVSWQRVAKSPTRTLIYALRSFDRWTPRDRTGWALRRDGFPRDEPFLIDVELWPLARANETLGNYIQK